MKTVAFLLIKASIAGYVAIGIAIAALIVGVFTYFLIHFLKWVAKGVSEFFEEKELDINGVFIEAREFDLPLQPINFNADLNGSYPLLVSNVSVHMYFIEIEQEDGKRISISVEKKLFIQVKDKIKRVGEKIKIHCTQFLSEIKGISIA